MSINYLYVCSINLFNVDNNCKLILQDFKPIWNVMPEPVRYISYFVFPPLDSSHSCL